jgi:exonuclease SbcC
MILNSISLENFISHKETNLDLDYGINVVIGPNGAGKTSILDAISFALFCDYSNRGKKENLINNKAKTCNVSLRFSEGGIKYLLEWPIKRRGSPKGKLYREQKDRKMLLAQGGAHSIIPEIEKILSLDKSMFLQSVYVRQGEIEKLVTARPAERKELISKLLNIEDLEKAYDRIKQVIDDYIKKQIVLKTKLEQKPTLEAEKKQYIAASSKLEKEIRERKDELKKIDGLITELKDEIKNLKAKKKKFNKLESTKQVLENQVKNIQEKTENLKSELNKSLQAEKIIEGLEEEIKKLDLLEDFSKNLSKKKETELKLESLEKELETLDELTKILEEFEEEHTKFIKNKELQRQISKERKQYEGSDSVWEKSVQHLKKLEKDRDKLVSSLEKILDKYQGILGAKVTVENVDTLLDEKKTESKKVNYQKTALFSWDKNSVLRNLKFRTKLRNLMKN